ncbi:C45 family peptidase [Marinirhabdus gelatinilytica]|uniref:Acyl-CoA:6-aminopenicillanic acid acyl transferase n=1 Tax=Marinirhabdus gelatinilytica TaxID=1703343 RepID=A0A370QK65_9FLAO|nr:C45 family peptidase [Marinirhabdus gelatinilytica]RDK88754.1 acyl-CoA:6-aminopenicillanic acid acyl transferase [Marinirhabdus gelatinilytica]
MKKILFYNTLLFLLVSCGTAKSLKDRPDISGYNGTVAQRVQISDTTFHLGNNFLHKNKYGLWELYIEGDPLERGLATGSLTQELLQKQERVFFSKVKELVPSETRQSLLRKILRWYNRKMYLHVPEEFKTEIYGLSRYSANTYNDIAPPYLRSLYLHSAHDIGHALQDLMLVGCTSFAVWDKRSEDGNLLLGRNFDFYAGDEFAEEKIIAFVNPEKGHKFMSVTWGGFVGVVSGMNDQGLTVTINAGKSKIPLVAKTPISIVTREILQHASNIEEAIAIAKKREVFVSESIMVGSAKDGKAVLIEVSPNDLGIFEVENTAELICSNHFQSEAYAKDRRNLKTIEESHTAYRFERMDQLLEQAQKVDVEEAVAILRNTKGLDNTEIGYGNEKALNQLLAHHGIVFQPSDLKVWVSANPYQLGAFVCYDLNEVFMERKGTPSLVSISEEKNTLPASPFLQSGAYKKYEAYREIETEIETEIEKNHFMYIAGKAEEIIRLNPKYWKAYYLAGRYYYEAENYREAVRYLRIASKKEIPSLAETEMVEKYLKKSLRKLD